MNAVLLSLLLASAESDDKSGTPPPSPSLSLSLSEVLAAVESDSPAVAAAVERAGAAERRADAAGAWSDPFVAVGPDEYTLGAEPPVVRYQVSQAIPLPGKIGPRVDAARAQTRIAEANVEVARRQLRATAIQLFLRAVYVDRALAANEAQRGILGEVIASAEGRYVTGGSSAHHDVLLATAERATLERDALVLERERAVLLAQIDELMGRTPAPGDASRTLVDDRADDAPLPPSLEDALAAQPELSMAAIGVEASEARRRAAAVAALPDLVVQGMAMQSFMPEVEKSNIGAMVGVSVPIQFPWKQGPLADAAAREKTAWEIDRRQLELRLQAEWREAQTRLGTAEDTLKLYDSKIAPATAAAVESSKAAYAAQSAPLVELLQVLRASTSVELERAAAELDVRLARARLVLLLSMPTPASLAPATPTLFGPSMGAMGAGMGSMGRGMGEGRMRPVRMGSGMAAPTLLESGGGDEGSGMGGM